VTQRVQIVFLVCIMSGGFVYLLYPKLVISMTEGGHWAVILTQGLLQMVFMLIFKKGLDYFPKKDVIDIFRQMGKWVAFILLVPFAFVLIALVGFGLRSHTDSIIMIFLNRTPYWVVLALLVFISAFAAIKGLETMLRSSVIIFIFVNLIILFITFTVMTNFDFHNALPAWPSSLRFLWNVKFSYITGFSPLLFMGFVPQENNMKYGQLFLVWTYVTFLILLIVYFPLFIYGQETAVTLTHNMVIDALDTVDLYWFFFSRQTLFFGITLISFTIFLNAVMLWQIGQIMQKVFNWQRTKPSYWILAFSLIAFLMGVFVPNEDMVEKLVWLTTGAHAVLIVFISFSTLIYGVLDRRRMAGYEKK
jgi:Spore germination protein